MKHHEYQKTFGVWSARLIKTACQLTGKTGRDPGGKDCSVDLPSYSERTGRRSKKDIFVVCGTNGKTTTNNLLASVLEGNGYKVVCNRTGSNMLNGVASAFVLAAGLSAT